MAGGNFDPYSHQNNDLSTSAGQRKFHRSASPSTDDARYVAGNQARASQAAAKRAASGSQSGGFGGLLGSIFGKDPRDRDRSTFRNPGKQEGIFGYEGFLRPKTGNAFQDLNRFMPMGLIAGAINAATTKPVDSGASYTMNTQRGVGPGTGTQQNLAGFTAPKVNTSSLKSPVPAGQLPPPYGSSGTMAASNRLMPGYIDPNFDTTSGFSNTVDISQNDDNMFGTNPLNFGAGEMNDLPLGPQSFFGGAIDAPADFFASADGGVSVEDAAFQEWLGTEGNSKAIQQWEATNPGFARRMFDRSQFLKRGGGVNSEGNM